VSAPPPTDDAETDVLRPAGAPPPGGPDEPEPEPGRQLGWGMLLGILVLVAVAGAIAAVYFATRDDSGSAATTASTTTAAAATVLPPTRVFVPDVTGLKQDEATQRLGNAHLVPVVEFAPTKKATGRVVSQKPKAGKRAKRGSSVTLVVDRGAPKLAVPDVTGMKAADAKAKLTDAGLKTQTTQVTSTDQPAGTVVSQAPAAGADTARGAAVTLSVARAPAGGTTAAQTTNAQATTSRTPTTQTTTAPPQPAAATVPDLRGATLQQATQALIDAGLLATLQYVPGDDPLGTILDQSPDAGTSAKPRSHVTVNLSAGPGQKEQETVPDASGQSLDQAVSTMNGAGLRLIFEKLPVPTRAQVGKVVEQTPAAGQTAPKNAQILVYIGVEK
jgi:serine/threonine-protein kinase